MSTKIHAACTLSSARQIPLCWPFLSAPKPPRHERQPVCSMAAGDLYGPCRQLQMNHSQKKQQTRDYLFIFKPQTCPPTSLLQPRNFPKQIHFFFSLPDVLLRLKEIQQQGNALKMSITRATWHSAGIWFWWRLSGRRENRSDFCISL